MKHEVNIAEMRILVARTGRGCLELKAENLQELDQQTSAEIGTCRFSEAKTS